MLAGGKMFTQQKSQVGTKQLKHPRHTNCLWKCKSVDPIRDDPLLQATKGVSFISFAVITHERMPTLHAPRR